MKKKAKGNAEPNLTYYNLWWETNPLPSALFNFSYNRDSIYSQYIIRNLSDNW